MVLFVAADHNLHETEIEMQLKSKHMLQPEH